MLVGLSLISYRQQQYFEEHLERTTGQIEGIEDEEFIVEFFYYLENKEETIHATNYYSRFSFFNIFSVFFSTIVS